MRDPEEAELGNGVEPAVGTERRFLCVIVQLHSGPPPLPFFHHSDSLHGVDVLKTQFQILPHINLVPRGMLLSIPAEYLLVEYFPLTGKFQFMWSGKLLLSNKPDANESH